MRIRFRRRPSESPELDSGPLLFQPLDVKRSRLGPLFGSLCLHALAVIAVTTLSQMWMASAPYQTDPARHRYEVFLFQTPEPTLYAPEPATPPKAQPQKRRAASSPQPRRSEPSRLTAPAAAETPAAPEPAPKVRRAFVPPAQMQFPRVENSLPAAPVILQPETRRAAYPKEISAPSVAAWARRYAPRRDFVAPARTQPNLPQPKLDAPPKLNVPNRAAAAGAINVLLARSPNANPILPLPDSSTIPVRAAGGASANDGGELGQAEGDPAQLIVISPATTAPGSMVEVPRGMRNVPPAGDPNSAGGNGSAQGPGRGAASVGGRGSVDQKGPVDGRGASGGRGAAGGRDSGNGTIARSSAGSLPGSPASVVTPEPRIRIVNPPSGSFDVVISQSAAPPALQGLGVSLSGSPVYTVYLKVGDDREWLLQYCLPVTNKPVANPYEVFVGAPASIAPPYPLTTAIPKSILGRRSSESVAFHGRLTASGSFNNLELHPQKSTLGLQILPLLVDWRFRPAAVDGRPAEVEILLVAPGQIN